MGTSAGRVATEGQAGDRNRWTKGRVRAGEYSLRPQSGRVRGQGPEEGVMRVVGADEFILRPRIGQETGRGPEIAGEWNCAGRRVDLEAGKRSRDRPGTGIRGWGVVGGYECMLRPQSGGRLGRVLEQGVVGRVRADECMFRLRSGRVTGWGPEMAGCWDSEGRRGYVDAAEWTRDRPGTGTTGLRGSWPPTSVT